MGGLAGMVHWKGKAPSRAVLDRMAANIVHRGPHRQGEFIEGPAALAKRTRQLLGTERNEPWVTDDFVVLLDGRIYDHEVLTRAAGYTKPATSATEAVAMCWRTWGVGTAQRLDGAFAIAVWDRKKQVIHLVRDRLGIRPLFYARAHGRFAFASELPALLQVPWVSRDLAREHIAEYLSFRVVHAPRTLLKQVEQVEPAHWLRAKHDNQQSRRYWSPLYAHKGAGSPPARESVKQLQDAVQHAVQRRLKGGLPTGLYLSGGLGSTAIGAAAKRLTRPLPTFTVAFADDPNPEAPIAGRVSRLLGMDHHDVLVGTAELAGAFLQGAQVLGHPVGNPAVMLQMLLAQAAAPHVKVVLSGDGSDELFGGRQMDRFSRWLRFARAYHRLPRITRAVLNLPLRASERGRRISTDPNTFGLDLQVGGSNLFSVDERLDLLREPVLARPTVRHDVLLPFYERLETDPVNATLHAFLRSWLGEDSLVRFDRTANHAGIEARFPLLDQEVVRLAASWPGHFKLRKAGSTLHTRWPMMALLDGVLPAPLVTRPKRGMPTPLDPWLVGPGRLFLEERFATLRRDRAGLFRTDALDKLHREVGTRPGAGARLWALFLLDGWMERVVGL